MIATKKVRVQNYNRFVLSNKKSIIHKGKNRNWNIKIFYLIFYYDLKLGSGYNLGKDLRKNEGYDKLVKHKNTEIYLHYIYL